MAVNVGSVDALVAAVGPACAAHQPAGGMSTATDDERIGRSRSSLLLEVTLEAQVRVALGEHLLIGGAVRTVAGNASFTGRLMREDEWTSLLSVALHAGFIGTCDGSSAALVSRALVRIMAIRAGHLAVQHLVGERHAELGFGIQVALEAGF